MCFEKMASSSLLLNNDRAVWDCREIDINEKCLVPILKYFNNRCMKYFWAALYHDGSIECDIINEFGGSNKYYHLFVWYKPGEISNKRKAYFSNLPFMQYVRRMYMLHGEIVYPTVANLTDVNSRIVSLLNSKHHFLKTDSHIPPWVEEELTQYLEL